MPFCVSRWRWAHQAIYVVTECRIVFEGCEMFVQSVNLYRGIAIILVVCGHTFEISNIKFDSFAEKLVCSLMSGATTIFVFISGFLFHHVFFKSYKYSEFMKSKFYNVVVPYLLLTTIPILLIIYTGRHYSNEFMPTGKGFVSYWIVPYLKYLVTGRALTAYWYIPFIFLVFLTSPFHVLFIKKSNFFQISAILIFYLASALIQRPIGNINMFQNLFYATGPYLLGIWCSINRQAIYSRLTGREWLLLAIAIGIAVAQALLGLHENFHKPPFEWGGIDLMLLQKAFLSLFFLVFLHRFEKVRSPVLEKISKVSFAIFFIHPWLLKGINEIERKLNFTAESWLLYIAATTSIIIVCVIAADYIKRRLGSRSRYIIGY